MSERQDERNERAHALMMAALDDELSSAERAELHRLLAADEGLRAEWAKLKTVKEVTETMSFREPPEEIWETYWEAVYNRVERGLAWVFISLGLTVVFAWAGWRVVDSILTDTSIPWWIKISIFAAGLGGIILFISVIRERWFAKKRDAYKEVLR
ncbi:MAG: hypothetical protein GTN89_16075 [Acidobacteria bacterium]|nr:hypothetical protein [Acidobacteriota bacterium]NIM62615.1 hypothetical protein [Acidobacteriota bacterium]NIO60748.1 hypothetical protein [Acidobacteriota bacterium]NIQ31820.1 hypothetical protein [Acidobacteriota bacterium]NIQ87148.1 hypothetical protein [Acidobacteriota bacterium]